MKHIGITVLWTSLLTMAAPAMAGTPYHAVKYNVENGVKVYRNSLSPAQEMAAQKHLGRLVRAEQRQMHRRAKRQRQEYNRKNAEAAFERGFARGYKQAQSQAHVHKHNEARRNLQRRRQYGRRYTTDLYGGQFGAYAYGRPIYLRRRGVIRARY